MGRPALEDQGADGLATASVTILYGLENHVGEKLTLTGGSYTIGSSEGVQLFLPEPTVAPIHAELSRRGADWIVLDRSGHRKTTFVNDERIESAELRHGDVIRVGRVLLYFDAGESRFAGAMSNLASHDGLTKLPNRKAFLYALEREVVRSSSARDSLGVFQIEPDRFDVITEQHGPVVSDILFARLAERIMSSTEHHLMIARLRGSVFGLLVAGSTSEQAQQIAEHIVERVAHEPLAFEQTSVPFTVSVGGVWVQPREPSRNALALFDQAGEELEQMMTSVGNGVRMREAPPSMALDALDAVDPAMAEDLDEADFFVAQGLYREARDIVASLVQRYPEHQGVAERLRSLDDHIAGERSMDASAGNETAFDEVDADIHFDLAVAYREMGLYEEAIKALRKILRAGLSSSRSFDAYFMLGQLCEMRGGAAEADPSYDDMMRSVKALARRNGFDAVDLRAVRIDSSAALSLPRSVAQMLMAFAYHRERDALYVALAYPSWATVKKLERLTGLTIEARIAPAGVVADLIRRMREPPEA